VSTTQGNISISVQASEIFTTTEFPGGLTETARTVKAAHSLNTQLNSTSVPVVDSPPVSIKLSTTTTIDLTAVQGLSVPAAATRTLDMTGKKVKGLIIKCGTTNAAAANIAPGASNPYPLFGTGNDIDLGPGAFLPLAFNGVVSNLPAVSSTVKTITVTISGSGTVELLLFFGA